MGTIVAIGGGELKYSETLIIDQYLVSLSKRKNPRLYLFQLLAMKQSLISSF